MKTKRASLCGAATLLVGFASLQAHAVSPAQQSACDRHHVAGWCPLLVFEFYTAHSLLASPPRSSPVSTLDSPLGDTKLLAADLAPRAALTVLQSDLKAESEQAAEHALQTISLGGAVNQTGGAAASSGSTDLAAKPTTTDFLSIAEQTGAFTSTQNGSAITLQASLLGMQKYLENAPLFRRLNSRAADALEPLTISANVNVAQSGSTTLPTTGSATPSTSLPASIILPANNVALTSVGVNYALYRPYNPQDKNFLAKWNAAVVANQQALQAAGSSIASALDSLLTPATLSALAQNLDAPLKAWHTAGAAAEREADFDAFVAAYSTYNRAFDDFLMDSPQAPKAIVSLNQAIAVFSAATETVLNQARGKPLATAGYLYSTPAQQPATHSFTLALAELFATGKATGIAQNEGNDTRSAGGGSPSILSGAQLTANFTAEIYATIPAGATYGRLRDLQISGEFDKPVGGKLDNPRATLSLAGYGQYQYDPTVLNVSATNLLPGTNIATGSGAQVLLGTSGWLGVVQGKVTLNLSRGLSLPLAIKWSNKTELLSSSNLRGQFGISYDLAALSKLLSSGN